MKRVNSHKEIISFLFYKNGSEATDWEISLYKNKILFFTNYFYKIKKKLFQKKNNQNTTKCKIKQNASKHTIRFFDIHLGRREQSDRY